MKYDFIIVGQGIAGSILSDVIKGQGYKALIIDDPSMSNSSRVAGGLYNPITGRKMVKTWNADKLFPFLEDYYSGLQKKLGVDFIHNKSIYRPFRSIEELNEWMGKSADVDYSPYVEQVIQKSTYGEHINDDFGGLLLKKSGYVDTATLLDAFSENLKANSELMVDAFDFSKLNVHQYTVSYDGIVADKIIFSDGQLLRKNPLFKWLPLRPVKGELLLIRVKEHIDVIYNRGVFVIPLSNGICKVGSTYDHNNLDNTVTEGAKKELSRRLSDLVRFPFEIIDQKAGIRPATMDRKPFIGIHPKLPNVGIFNGFGTKGVSLIPYYADQFVNSMTKGLDLDNEVNISRYFSLY